MPGSSKRFAPRFPARVSLAFRAAPGQSSAAISMRWRLMRLGLDWTIEPEFARSTIQTRWPVQGNLDPVVLLGGGEALDRSIDAVLAAFAQGPFIFNLGHGVSAANPDSARRAAGRTGAPAVRGALAHDSEKSSRNVGSISLDHSAANKKFKRPAIRSGTMAQ